MELLKKHPSYRAQLDAHLAECPLTDDGYLTVYALGGFLGLDCSTPLEYQQALESAAETLLSTSLDHSPVKAVENENLMRLEAVSRLNAFIMNLEASETADVTKACKDAAVSREYVYRLRSICKAFDRRWQGIYDKITDSLEAEAVRRAMYGVDEDIIFKGELVGTKTVYSDSLLTNLLKARRPDVYGERITQSLVGKDGESLNKASTADLTADELKEELIARGLPVDLFQELKNGKKV